MESIIKTKLIRIDGMTCVNCQNKIEQKLQKTTGIKKVNVSYRTGKATVTYDANMISEKKIIDIIEKLDYRVLKENEQQKSNMSRTTGTLAIIIASYMLLQRFGLLNLLVPSQLADTKMGYGMLFVIGLLTSVHCVAMCGGINISQCLPQNEKQVKNQNGLTTMMPAFLYNFGRVISYTVIGFILGFAGMLMGGGSAVGLPIMLQGILKLIAGAFMVIMGINMLGLFPWLYKFQPSMPKMFAHKIGAEKAKQRSPLIVGLLNGLMPCGPLQSMQIVALASGNPFAGALSMFLFSLGTVPLMLGLGSIISALGQKFTTKVMNVGAVLVVVLGLAMLSQGGSLSGLSGVGAVAKNTTTDSGTSLVTGQQLVNSTLSARRYPNITVEVGTPLKWVIDAPGGSINGCNNRMLIQEYGIEHTFNTGENIIEFTPSKVGTIQYSCWMGMIQGTITVTEVGAAPTTDTTESAQENDILNPTPAGYMIPTDKVAIAEKAEDEYGDEIQEVTITLTDDRFTPALVIVQAGSDVKWNIINSTSNTQTTTPLLIPSFYTQLDLSPGENPLYFSPDTSFDFYTSDGGFYGYVKVVEDIKDIDIEAIKSQVSAFETMTWPPETFQGNGGASCH